MMYKTISTRNRTTITSPTSYFTIERNLRHLINLKFEIIKIYYETLTLFHPKRPIYLIDLNFYYQYLLSIDHNLNHFSKFKKREKLIKKLSNCIKLSNIHTCPSNEKTPSFEIAFGPSILI